MLPLHRNDSPSIVACLFFAMRMCSVTRCLAMEIHVTISSFAVMYI
jgi:hypothetical protein